MSSTAMPKLIFCRDAFMHTSGILVDEWPFTPGADAPGVVVKSGKNAVSALGTPFQKGDKVAGCVRLGSKGYSPYAEFFLMDAKLTLPIPDNLTIEQGSTLGVATYVSYVRGIVCEVANLDTRLPAWEFSRS
jgi:NADPH:quinone reductase-like Zn-dependent oxidoreductase